MNPDSNEQLGEALTVELFDDMSARIMADALAYHNATHFAPCNPTKFADCKERSCVDRRELIMRMSKVDSWITRSRPLSAAPADEWLPIESAPRDGTAIIVGGAGNTSQAVRWMISDAKGAPNGAWFVGGYDGHRLRWEPTHWIDLPIVSAVTEGDRVMDAPPITGLNAEAKSEIARLMREKGWSRSELSRALEVRRVTVTQMLDPARNLTLDTLERVVRKMGYTVHLDCKPQLENRYREDDAATTSSPAGQPERCDVSVTGKHRIDPPFCKDCGQKFPLPAAASEGERVCTWTLDGDWIVTACGESSLPPEDWDGEDHGMKFCCHCGARLAVSDELRTLNADYEQPTAPTQPEGEQERNV